MRVLTIVHDEDAGPGVFLDSLAAGAVELQHWRPVYEAQPPAGASAYDAILTLGGNANPDQADLHRWLAAEKRFLADALGSRVPLIGVCLGAELIAEAAAGGTRRVAAPEIGWCEVRLTPAGAADPVLGGMPQRFPALEWHSYEVILPTGATALAHSDSCLQAFRIGDRAWGIQFHAEVTAEDFQSWLDTYLADEVQADGRIDAEEIMLRTELEITAWNEAGRGICSRFLKAAAGR